MTQRPQIRSYLDSCLSGSVPIREICGSNLKNRWKKTTDDAEATDERPFESLARKETTDFTDLRVWIPTVSADISDRLQPQSNRKSRQPNEKSRQPNRKAPCPIRKSLCPIGKTQPSNQIIRPSNNKSQPSNRNPRPSIGHSPVHDQLSAWLFRWIFK
jgi:hypothetical protein